MNIEIENEIDKNIGLDLTKEKNEFGKIISSVLDKASNYIIKMMPIPENLKDVIKDIKEAVKTKDMKKVVSTAINSSLREGMEFLGISDDKVKDILKIKDALFKGGIRENLCAGIDTAYSKYIKNNLLSEDLENFVSKLKESVNSKEFSASIDSKTVDIIKAQQNIDKLCSKWYEAYEKFDLNSMNSINSEIAKGKSITIITKEQEQKLNVINNMTKLVSTKNSKLNDVEINFCKNA